MAGKPVWKLLSDYAPDQVVDLVDWRYLTDALTPSAALDLLKDRASGKSERELLLRRNGYPAYTTTPGWLGYSDDLLVRLAQEAVASGFGHIKLKVGADLAADIRRMRLARAAVGPDVRIAVDANQRWEVDQAIEWMAQLAPYDPWWIEEPTSPDDILGHAAIRRAVAPIKVATGEHTHNRVMFKQLLAAGAIDVLQLDACRVGGVTENVAILLLAAAFDVPVCPHAGGVGLCELVQHLAMFDFVAVSGSTDGRAIEYIDHLHEHFADPVAIERGHYMRADPGRHVRSDARADAGRLRLPDRKDLAMTDSPTARSLSGSDRPPGVGSIDSPAAPGQRREQELSRACRRSTTCTSTCAPARCMPSWARTAPASPR